MDKLADIFTKNVRAALERRNWTQARLADECGLVQPAISRYMSGKSEPGIEMVARVANALGIQPWELIKPEGAEPTPAPTESRETVFGRVVAKLAAVEDDEFWTISELILHFGRADAADFELSGEITPEQFPRNQKRPK